jgi:hypothetical protein
VSADSWRAFYAGDVQSLWALIAVPAIFLVVVALRPPPGHAIVRDAAGFMRAYALVFALETILDPVVGGPGVRWLGIADPTAVIFLFVLLGDFRVFLLVFTLARHRERDRVRRGVLEALPWTFVVPVVTFVVHTGLRAVGVPLPPQALWLIYELSFLAMAVFLWTTLVPARTLDEPRLTRYLQTVLAYVAVYYALWAAADVLILAGIDLGWALRVLPNQLYYALYVPFVWVLFFSRR